MKQCPELTADRLNVAIKATCLVLTFILCGCVTKHQSTVNDDLVAAAKLGDVGEVTRLLDNGADVNSQDKNGITPLVATAFYGNLEVAKILLGHGAVVNAYGTSDYPALVAAIMQDQRSMAELLINNGADINIKLRDGTSPLHVAVLQGSVDMVALLIEDGADINARDKDGQTPLDDSVANQNRDLVKLLVSRGADVNARDQTYIDAAGLSRSATVATMKTAGIGKKKRHGRTARITKPQIDVKKMPSQFKTAIESQ